MTAFQNRKKELARIMENARQTNLLNIYGEAGIGKTRLLTEAKARILDEHPSALVLVINLALLVAEGSVSEQIEALLRAILRKGERWLEADRGGRDEVVAGQIAVQLNKHAKRIPVMLMFDNTEKLQENMEFWDWMEAYLIGPLAVEGRVQQIFAGRVPVPWRRVEVRRAVDLVRLEPLSPEEEGEGEEQEDPARALVRDALEEEGFDVENEEQTENAADLIIDLSFGHPLLSERLAAYLTEHWDPSRDEGETKKELCEEVIEPFIEEEFLEGITPPWNKIIYWASILDRFDATILQEYLDRVGLPEVEGKPDFFFIQGISRLRIHDTVIWRERRGDRLHGVIRDIVRQNFRILRPDDYRRACEKAAQTFHWLADQFPQDSEEAHRYREEAAAYKARLAEVTA